MNQIDNKFFFLVSQIQNTTYEKLVFRIKKGFCFLPENIKANLENYFATYDFWGSLSEEKGDFDEIEKKAKVLKCHISDFVWLYRKLEDYSSKFLLFAILNNWLNYDFTSLKQSICQKGKHYFDYDLLAHCKNEVFVDVGAYTGDTVLDFINFYGKDSYKQIYCFEITPSIFDCLQTNLKNYSNITFVNKALKNKPGFAWLDENSGSVSANRTSKNGAQKILCTTLDNEVKQKVSLIKMDIEGDEEKALIGCKRHITVDNPKLFISLYHKNEHYYKLPRLIYRYNKNYKFFLRNYGGGMYPTEIVLLAFPK